MAGGGVTEIRRPDELELRFGAVFCTPEGKRVLNYMIARGHLTPEGEAETRAHLATCRTYWTGKPTPAGKEIDP
jgi:hypothetical protein